MFEPGRQPCPPLQLLSEMRSIPQSAGVSLDWLDVDIDAERELERQLNAR
jgi:hypothetical protein